MIMFKKETILSIITMLFFVFDRISKLWALTLGSGKVFLINKSVNSLTALSYIPRLYFKLIFNRGMSWGLLNSDNHVVFMMVTLLTCAVTVIVLGYLIVRYRNGYSIFPLAIIFLGSLSNIVDRLLYQGVIDFIVVDFGKWIFPVFNLADCAIVFGVFLMFVEMVIKDYPLSNDYV